MADVVTSAVRTIVLVVGIGGGDGGGGDGDCVVCFFLILGIVHARECCCVHVL